MNSDQLSINPSKLPLFFKLFKDGTTLNSYSEQLGSFVASTCISKLLNCAYFELTILDLGNDKQLGGLFAIGITDSNLSKYEFPGSTSRSFGMYFLNILWGF